MIGSRPNRPNFRDWGAGSSVRGDDASFTLRGSRQRALDAAGPNRIATPRPGVMPQYLDFMNSIPTRMTLRQACSVSSPNMGSHSRTAWTRQSSH